MTLVNVTQRVPRNRRAAMAMIAIAGFATLLSACGSGDSSSSTPVTFAPSSGPVGTVVSFTGADFSTTQSVTIGGTAAIPLSQSASTLEALVMPRASSGPVSVTTAAGPLTIPGTFTVSATGVPARQQGAKLVGTGASGPARQGFSVAVSADGSTAVVGGPVDNTVTGAAWVFTRVAGAWTQQGAKLVGTGASGPARQGFSVAVSADGNTAVVGGFLDNATAGAAWVFTP